MIMLHIRLTATDRVLCFSSQGMWGGAFNTIWLYNVSKSIIYLNSNLFWQEFGFCDVLVEFLLPASFFHFQIIIRFEMFIVIIVSDLSPHCIDLLKIDRLTICDNLWELSLIALICWKLTMWQLEGASTQFSPWTLSFSSNFSARTLKFYSSKIGSLYNNQLLTISSTVNIFPCAIHVHPRRLNRDA